MLHTFPQGNGASDSTRWAAALRAVLRLRIDLFQPRVRFWFALPSLIMHLNQLSRLTLFKAIAFYLQSKILIIVGCSMKSAGGSINIFICNPYLLAMSKVAVTPVRNVCGAAAPPYPLGATARTSRRSVFGCGKCGNFIKTHNLPQPPAPPALNILSLGNVIFGRFHNLLCLRHGHTNG